IKKKVNSRMGNNACGLPSVTVACLLRRPSPLNGRDGGGVSPSTTGASRNHSVREEMSMGAGRGSVGGPQESKRNGIVPRLLSRGQVGTVVCLLRVGC